eukprot:8921870-Alexandrium_andersonii.AAC.1
MGCLLGPCVLSCAAVLALVLGLPGRAPTNNKYLAGSTPKSKRSELELPEMQNCTGLGTASKFIPEAPE